MGPIALFDKSFLQSLSVDESVFFDHFFMPVVCPVFYIETLGDLEKNVRQGRTPEQEVGIIADKVPQMSGGPCAFHVDIGAANLFGSNIPLNGQVPRGGGRPVKVDGKSGFMHPQSPEDEAFGRWQNRQFLDVERLFASTWRATLGRVNLAMIAENMRAMNISPQTCKSLEDARAMARKIVIRGGNAAADRIRMALHLVQVPEQYGERVLERWRFQGRPALSDFAPYAAHLLAVELFFRIALGANLISTTDANNRTDVAYLFYSPFCHVFVSSDNLHRRCAPLFLRPDQNFVWGPELKTDLNRLMNHFAGMPEEEKARGLYSLAPSPPQDDNGLVAQLWDRYLKTSWRTRERKHEIDTAKDAELVKHVNRISDAPGIPLNEMDVDPAEPDFVQIQRRIFQRKGSWWQLPKDIKR